GTSLDETGDTSLDEVVLPAPNRRLRYPNRAHDRHHASTVSRHEHDLRTFDDFLGHVAVPQYALEFGAIPRKENKFCLLPHRAARESYSRHLGNQMFVTEH